MKVEIEKTNTEPKSKYPYLGISKNDGSAAEGIVILFSAEDTGMCICSGESAMPVGEFCNQWAEEEFEPFTGTVKLSND